MFAATACSVWTDLDSLASGDPALERDPDPLPPVSEASAGDVSDAPGPVILGDAGSAYRAAVQSDHPILYWRLGDDDPATVVAASGPGGAASDAGILRAVTGALRDDPDRAVQFRETGSVVLADAALADSAAPFTVELWLKPMAAFTKERFLLAHERPSGLPSGYRLVQTAGGLLSFRGYVPDEPADASSTSALTSQTALRFDAFTHLAVTFDQGTVRLYVNGEEDSQLASVPSFVASVSSLVLGHALRGGLDSPDGFSGAVDEFALYDVALPSHRIEKHYKVGLGLE